jgi:hypothetical protein
MLNSLEMQMLFGLIIISRELMADMTSGVRVLIEIAQKGGLDDATIRNCGLISTVLPFRGMRYMVVFSSQFQRVLSGESE